MDQKERKSRSIAVTSEEDMRKAVNLVVTEGFGLREVSRRTGIKYATLQRYVNKKKQNKSNGDIRYGPCYDVAKVFSYEQETMFAEYLKNCSYTSQGLKCLSARKLAYQFAERNNLTVPLSWRVRQVAGRSWLRSFLKRQDLTIKKLEATGPSKITSNNPYTDPDNVNIFYDKLAKVLNDHPTIKQSQGKRIFNLDETETYVMRNRTRVHSKTELKHVSNIEKGLLITTCCIVSAEGTFLPPALVFPRKNFKSTMISGAPTGTLGLANLSGSMTSDLFIQVFDHFIQHSNSSKQNPTLLICDSHKSHESLEIMEKAQANGVVLLTLPSHCSHKLQPLEVGVFESFNAAYNKACESWMKDNPGSSMRLEDVSPLITAAFQRSMTSTNIVSGFSDSGIYPFNPNIMKDADFVQSSIKNDSLIGTNFLALPCLEDSTSSTSEIKTELDESGNEGIEVSASFFSRLSAEIKLVEELAKHALELIEETRLKNGNNSAISQLHEEITKMKCSESNSSKLLRQLRPTLVKKSSEQSQTRKSRTKRINGVLCAGTEK